MRCRNLRDVALTILISVVVTRPALTQTQIPEWLVLGPLPAPAIAGGANAPTLPDGLFSFDTEWPSSGTEVRWFNGQDYRWQPLATSAGTLTLEAGERTIAMAVTYLVADRWQRVEVKLDGRGARRAWVDGSPVSGDVNLTQGSHWLLVETTPAEDGRWDLFATIKSKTLDARITASVLPRRAPTLTELEALPSVTGVKVDPSGRRGAFLIRHTDTVNDRWVTTLAIRDVEQGRLVRELGLTTQAMHPAWSRDGSQLAFATVTDQQGGTGLDLWVWELEGRGARRVRRNEPGVSSLQFSADGSWLYFTGTVKPDSAKNAIAGAARFTDVWERWGFWKDKAQLYAVHTKQGTRVTLAGDAAYSVSAPALSPDGQRFVYGREVRFPKRPFVRVELWLLDVTTLASQKLVDLPSEAFSSPRGYAWSPDGRAVAFCASTRNMLEHEDPEFSVFETELYGVPLAAPRLVPLNRGVIPSLGMLGCAPLWTRDGHITVNAQNGSRVTAARTTAPVDGSLRDVTLGLLPLAGGETMGVFDVAGPMLVGAFESPVTPQQVYRMHMATAVSMPLFDPTDDALAQADMPAWQEWTFTDADGWEIDGWYLTPPNFDNSQKYPMVVWYYGGTAATSRTFDRRLASYAAQGYVVYVLNPAGAPGWGQEFSNLHIDDWGFPAGSDIIEGVTKFAQAHAFVDADRIGNFGHSYGGFMTMHMATRTDLFAASASIAGISNIANYWGAGWTGYSYTEGTCPGCYPWNRRDLYVDRSPLFQADRISAPLLLIHGTHDTNVVPTESEQMFTALRVLGKETELVRFLGEDHGVNSKPSVQYLRDIMMFEWFDRYLRDRPEAWLERWGGGEKPKAVDPSTGDGG